jgi:RNA polymerase sigma factor (sigma-70 family)
MDDFSKLAAQYTPMIYRIIRSLSIYKNKEEFFQIGLIALWEAQAKFDPSRGIFLNYAYTVVKGRILNELKKEHRLDERTMPLEMESYEVSKSMLSIEEPLALENLKSYCESLTNNQKNWLLLTFQEDRSLSEISEQFGVSVAAVKSWRQSALKRLRKQSHLQPL